MYRIYYHDSVLTNQRTTDFAFVEGLLEQKLNVVDIFTFKLSAKHPHKEIPEIRCLPIELRFDDKILFKGDVIDITTDFAGNRVFSCQGVLGWLNDVVVVRPRHSGSVKNCFEWIMSQYNDNCSAFRTLNIGECNVTGSHEFDYEIEFDTVFNLLKKLIGAHGGYVFVRFDGPDVYIDYISSKSRTSSQSILFGQNLINLENFIDGSALFSRLYPIGKDGIDITSVNNGSAYISSPIVREGHGEIAVTVEFDAETPTALLREAQTYLNAQSFATQTLTLSAFDLSLLDASIDSFDVGENVRVRSPGHGIDVVLQVSEKNTSLSDPQRSTVTLGATKSTLSGIVA